MNKTISCDAFSSLWHCKAITVSLIKKKKKYTSTAAIKYNELHIFHMNLWSQFINPANTLIIITDQEPIHFRTDNNNNKKDKNRHKIVKS